MNKNNQKNTPKKNTTKRYRQPRVSAEDRKMFWEMISRKGGIEIRF